MPEASDEKARGQHAAPRVVVLGGGYGGVYAALHLQKAAKRGEIELSLVSRDNFFLSLPMMSEVVSGSIEPPHIVSPIRRLLPRSNFYQAEIESIDVDNRDVVVKYQGDRRHYAHIPYDHLVVAVGGSTDLSGLPGMQEHAFPFKTLGDALFLRNHLIAVLEQAEVESDPREKAGLLTFVVAGGGYTGVEVAAEINSFMREAARSYRHIDPEEVKVILLHSRDRILPVLPEKLARFGHRVLERNGLDIRLNTRIRGATAESAIMGDGVVIPTRTLVAALGSAHNRLLEKIPGERDARGRLVVDRTLAVPDHPGIWAVGDCAAVHDHRSGSTCPPTAQFALRQARLVARNILADIRGKALRPFSYKSLGVFVPLGRFSAAADIMGFKLSGFPAWWLYRTFYLYQLPRLKSKLRVVTDWTLELLFHRDIVQLDTIRSEGISRGHYLPGELIYREGDPARNFYTILSGQVQVVRQQEEGETPVATLTTGEYFGEMSLLKGPRHSASVRALTAVDLLIMNGADFKKLAKHSTQFAETLNDVMQQRLSADQRPESAADDTPAAPIGSQEQ